MRFDHVAGFIENQNKHRIRMGTKVTPLLFFRVRFYPLRALTRQPSLPRIVNFHQPKSMKTPRSIILSSALLILALMLVSCASEYDERPAPLPPPEPYMGGIPHG
jgi:hypothetical protein